MEVVHGARDRHPGVFETGVLFVFMGGLVVVRDLEV
jgi:hypothetical protein